MAKWEPSGRERQLWVDLLEVQGCLKYVERLPLIAAALERGLSLREITELVEAAQRTIEIALESFQKENDWAGVRGLWRRYVLRQSPSDPLARWSPMGRDAVLTSALRDGVRVVKALRMLDRLSAGASELADA